MNELDSALAVAKHAPEGFTTLAAAFALWRLAKIEGRLDALCDHLGAPRAKAAKRRGLGLSLMLAAFLCLSGLALPGCTFTEVTLSDGSRLKRWNTVFTTRIAAAELRGTNGAAVKLRGYESDAAAVAEAAARGAAQGAKP